MEKMKKIACAIALFAIVLLFSGCSSSTASASDIKNEIIQYDNYDILGLKIKSYEETMRKTSSENGVDSVTVRVVAENDKMEIWKDYSLVYVKYDNGWILENINSLNTVYTVKNVVDIDTVKSDSAERFKEEAFSCNLHEYNTREPELIFSELNSADGDVHCVYSVACFGENEFATIQLDMMMYYVFDPNMGWCYSEEYSDMHERELVITPKDEPTETLAEQALIKSGIKDFQVVCQLDDENGNVEFTYYVLDADTYKYLTIHYNYYITCAFDAASGWYIDDIRSEIINTDIDACGVWEYNDGKGEHEYRFSIMSVNEEKVVFTADLVITDWAIGFGDTTHTVSTNGETRERNWVKTERADYALKTEKEIVSFKFSYNTYYLEFYSFAGEKYDESGFYFNDCLLTRKL